MKKRILLLAAALLLLAGCSTQAPQGTVSSGAPTVKPEISVSLEDIADEIITEDQFGMLMDMELDFVQEQTGLNGDIGSMMESYLLKEPPMAQATTLYLAKATDEKYVEEIKGLFQKKLELVRQTFERYLPDEYEKAMAGQVVSNGKYVMMVIAQDSQKAVDTFNGFFK